jgi:hypothetical protein
MVLAVAVLLLSGAFTASVLRETALDELAVLYTVPVMLVGLELRVTGGVAGASSQALRRFVAFRTIIAGLYGCLPSQRDVRSGRGVGRWSLARRAWERMLRMPLRPAGRRRTANGWFCVMV